MLFRHGIDTPMSKGFMISIFGRVIDDPDLLEFAYAKVPPGYVPKQTFRQKIQYYRVIFLFLSLMEHSSTKNKPNDSQEIFARMFFMFHYLITFLFVHIFFYLFEIVYVY